MYSTILQSTIITRPTGFNIALTNVNARLKQRCINVVSTLFQRRALTLYQRCATLKIRRRILFHFQRRINVISTLIQNVETTLIRLWNVGSVNNGGSRKGVNSFSVFFTPAVKATVKRRRSAPVVLNLPVCTHFYQ